LYLAHSFLATAAYQVEGAYNVGGRSPSIWDVFCENPAHCSGENGTYWFYFFLSFHRGLNSLLGTVADDHYHKVAEDVQLLKDMNVNHYRFVFYCDCTSYD
jgi:beta-glucosidase/6-phospho-beta-glucosidase/beta-galactosidase